METVADFVRDLVSDRDFVKDLVLDTLAVIDSGCDADALSLACAEDDGVTSNCRYPSLRIVLLSSTSVTSRDGGMGPAGSWNTTPPANIHQT